MNQYEDYKVLSLTVLPKTDEKILLMHKPKTSKYAVVIINVMTEEVLSEQLFDNYTEAERYYQNKINH